MLYHWTELLLFVSGQLGAGRYWATWCVRLAADGCALSTVHMCSLIDGNIGRHSGSLLRLLTHLDQRLANLVHGLANLVHGFRDLLGVPRLTGLQVHNLLSKLS